MTADEAKQALKEGSKVRLTKYFRMNEYGEIVDEKDIPFNNFFDLYFGDGEIQWYVGPVYDK